MSNSYEGLSKSDILKDIKVVTFNRDTLYPGRAYAVIYEDKLRDAILTEIDDSVATFIDTESRFKIDVNDIMHGRASIIKSMYTGHLDKDDILSTVTEQIIDCDVFKDKIGKPFQINFTEDDVDCNRVYNDFIGLLYDYVEEYLRFMSSYRGKIEIPVSSIINSHDFSMREMK